MIETNDFSADDLPAGSQVRLVYDPEAFVLLREDPPVTRQRAAARRQDD
jgi:spermidine/putrescine transport system ATP-binding protein